MTPKNKILVLGAANDAGRLVRETLRAFPVEVLAVADEPMDALSTRETLVCADLTDARAVDRLCRGADVVISMGGMGAPMDEGNGLTNAVGSIANFYEAARINGVRRVIAASPDAIVGLYRRSAVLDHLSLPRPDSRRGVVGATQEAIAALYAYKHGLSALCIRMGALAPEPTDERMLSSWLSHDDFRRLIRMALTADYCYEVVYGVSANTRGWWDNMNAVRLGYRPEDNAERYADRLGGERPADAVSNVLQGSTAREGFSGNLRHIP